MEEGQVLEGQRHLYFFLRVSDGTSEYQPTRPRLTKVAPQHSVTNPPGGLEQMAALASRAARFFRRRTFGLSCVLRRQKTGSFLDGVTAQPKPGASRFSVLPPLRL